MEEKLFDAIIVGDFEEVKRLTTPNNINERDRAGFTPLLLAIANRDLKAADFFVDYGADLNIKDNNGQIALHFTALHNDIDLAQKLLSRGANINIGDNYGNQPLWTAVFNVKGRDERLGIVRLFLQYNANKNHKNNWNKSPLDFAKQTEFYPLLELLTHVTQ